MTKQIKEYIVLAFVLGFAFEFGGQIAWMMMDAVKAAINIPLG